MDLPPAFYRSLVSVIALIVFKLAVDKALSIRAAFTKIKDSPGRASLWLPPFSPLALALGPRFPRPGMGGYYGGKFAPYKKIGSTAFASVSLADARPVFWLADPEAIKRVALDRHTFPKNVHAYSIIDFCGGNVFSLEGPDWKRHRSIIMSAFTEANIALVWSESLRVISDWFQELDASGPDVTVNLLQAMTKVALLVIPVTAFGKRVSWSTDPKAEAPPGYKLTFRSAFMNSVNSLVFRAITPEWFYQLSSLIKVPYLSSRALRSQLAFRELRIHMLDLVASARAAITSGELSSASGAVLLRNLVEANMNQDGDSKQLTDGEILSNIFIFLIAGHDTTAHALGFALTLLALYPDYQKKIHEEVTRVWPTDVSAIEIATNHKEYMDKLVRFQFLLAQSTPIDSFPKEFTLACVRETLRIFPPEPRFPKDVETDTVLPGTHFTAGSEGSPSAESRNFTMVIPAGSLVILDVWGLHMNPLCWGEDAAEFKPERFLDTESYQWPRDAFLPFSAGARSCIGRRFALTEATGIVASVVRRYQICIPDDLAKKPFEEQKEVLLKWATGISLTPLNARVKLCRRV